MLDTTSIHQSTEFPLFGTMASSSSTPIQIQRPLPTESYSWCDFPISLQNDSLTTSAATTYNPAYGCAGSSSYPQHPMTPASSSYSFPPSPSTISSTASESSISTVSSQEETPTTNNNTHRRSQSETTSTSRNVRFAPSPHVRTYSLVLGDHPFCDDGLAIELGWDYNEEENTSNNTPQQQPMIDGIPSSDRIKTICQRRSYLSRKQLLLNVAGCTKEELDRRKKDSELEARNHREDYVYHQALAKTMLR